MSSSKPLTSLVLAALACGLLTACPADPPLGPAPGNMTGSVSSSATWNADASDDADADADADATDSDGLDLPGCDLFEDPATACGSGQECDPETLSCVPATGGGSVDEACVDEADCAAGLACSEGQCAVLCDASLVAPEPGTLGACPDGQLCAEAFAPLPGVCRQSCLLIALTCEVPGFACNRIDTSAGVQAACTPNPGYASAGAACSSDSDCASGLLCSPAEVHSTPCALDAPACCADVCDPFELPCFGIEPVCYSLQIPDQTDAGFCGVE